MGLIILLLYLWKGLYFTVTEMNAFPLSLDQVNLFEKKIHISNDLIFILIKGFSDLLMYFRVYLRNPMEPPDLHKPDMASKQLIKSKNWKSNYSEFWVIT